MLYNYGDDVDDDGDDDHDDDDGKRLVTGGASAGATHL